MAAALGLVAGGGMGLGLIRLWYWFGDRRWRRDAGRRWDAMVAGMEAKRELQRRLRG